MAAKHTTKLLAGFLAGNAFFYGVLIANRLLVRRTGLGRTCREICDDFGWAEFIDWFPVRPALIVLCAWLLQSESLGACWGHGAADIVFYYLGFSHAGPKIAETVCRVAHGLRV